MNGLVGAATTRQRHDFHAGESDIKMTDTEFEKFWNENLTYIWEQINWIDERLEQEPDHQKQKQLDVIMERLKAAMELKKEKAANH